MKKLISVFLCVGFVSTVQAAYAFEGCDDSNNAPCEAKQLPVPVTSQLGPNTCWANAVTAVWLWYGLGPKGGEIGDECNTNSDCSFGYCQTALGGRESL